MKHVRYVDLFCGIGSFHYAFQQLGWECVMACDIDVVARTTYERNYHHKPLADIVNIEANTLPEYDIVCAGFPCQPFSQCGQHRGFNDERGTMFFHVMRFVRRGTQRRPRIVILENVPALLHHDQGRTMERIRQELEGCGYALTWDIWKCSDYGIPQNRKRLFIIAVLASDPLQQHIDHVLNVDSYRKESDMSTYLHRPFIRQHAYTIRCGGRRSPIHDRHNWDGYIMRDDSEYRLTIQDCLRLQGFDEHFKLDGKDTDQWRLVGNTIPTIFTTMLGKNIHRCLQEECRHEP